MSQRRHRMRDDRGIAIVLVSMLLLVLLAMAAFAVDLGRIYAERRQDQSAVDAGTLSGAWQMLYGTSATDAVVFNEVTRITYEGLDKTTRPATLDAWRALWPACTDPDAPGRGYTVRVRNPGNTQIDCIRKTANGRAIRVKLPQRSIDTVFAGVIGIDTLSTSAFAEAGLTPQETNILPFAVTATDANQFAVSCLVTPPNGFTHPDCNGPNQGNFGFLASPRPTSSANQACNGGWGDIIENNIASGLDHSLSVYDGTTVMDECVGVAVPGVPNTMWVQPGNNEKVPDSGLIGGQFEDGGRGRLTRGSCALTTNTRVIRQGDPFIDWCPLWTYFRSFSVTDVGANPDTQIPASCWAGVALLRQDGNPATNPTKATMAACLNDYWVGGYTTDLFTGAIADSARYAWVPANSTITDLNGQSTPFRIESFRVVFLQTIWLKDGNTFIEYNPGEGNPPNAGKNASFAQISGFSIPRETIPASVYDAGPQRGLPSLSLIR